MLKADTFWKEALAKAPRMIALPAPRSGAASKEEEVSSRGNAQAFIVPAALAARLDAAAGEAGLESTFATAFAWLLHRHSGEPALRIALVDAAGESIPVP